MPLIRHLADSFSWDARVYIDTERRGPLWNMERIMEDNADDGVLILQDDVFVPEWFEEEFLKCWIPESPMTFFLGMSKEPLRLWEEGYSYAATKNVWGQANWFPPEFIGRYLEWSVKQPAPTLRGEEAKPGVRKYSGDDTSVCMFLKESGAVSLMTLPHLVNHQAVKSTLGHPTWKGERARVSRVFGKQYLRPWDKAKIGRLTR